MKQFEQMRPERLAEIVARFSQASVAVVGDFFLDKYFDIAPALAERSLETGLTAHQVVAVRHSPGAAGTIVANLSALGCGTMHAVGYTGDDGEGYDLRRDLAAIRCQTDHLPALPDRFTPTYLKPRDAGTRDLAGEHSRYDTKNRTPTPESVQDAVIAALEALAGQVQAVIALDQVDEPECGVITSRVRACLGSLARRHRDTIFWADSRHQIRRFRDVIVKVNQFEAAGIESPPPGSYVDPAALREAIVELRVKTRAPLVVTRAEDGMVVSDPELTAVPTLRVEGPIDPTGAGDSVTAGAVLALVSGATFPEAALVGNLVASITIRQLATTGTARPEQLAERLAAWQAQRKESSAH